ncbi:MAG TPA: Lrp/AsnC family transcriptional regulator [Anaerolineales bacterium]|nr:Lrp/AsnC family transcriptional regulator [Anaerolineales bacterium]
MSHTLDETDRKILDLLQRDARMTNAAIAAEVGLTAPSVFERIRKLEQRGVIRGYRVDVDPAALGRPLTAFIRLTVASDEKNEAGIRAIRRDPDVLECYHVAGEDCYILKTRASDPGELEALLARLRKQMNIQRSVTMIALSVIKEGAPLNTLPPPSALPANHKSSRKRK